MKKIILSIIILSTTFFEVFSQEITPLRTSEQCPGVNITFTVTIAAQSIQSVQPKALNVNPTVVQQPFNITPSGSNLIFNFIGRFADYNNKQTFTVFYTSLSGQSATWDATFIKIKSLLTANSFSQIFPAPASISSPRCQLNNHNISFANVKYGNPFEAPIIGYGTVTNYEYLLPSGWKIGPTTSNGTTWIAGGNNVTITSDLATGDGSVIKIRPTNIACASGLVTGQEANVFISRPKPTTITNPNNLTVLCTSSTYTLNLIPPGATVCWTLSNNTVASIPSSPFCGNSVTVTRNGINNGNTILTANVSDCSGTYPPINFTIAVGTPGSASLQVNDAWDFCNSGWMQFDATLENPSPKTTLRWSVSGNGAKMKFGATGYTPVIEIKPFGSFAILGVLTNSCGTTNYNSGIMNSADFWSSYCGSYRFSVSPNPVKGNMNIMFDKPIKENETVRMTLYSLNSSKMVRQWTQKGGQCKLPLFPGHSKLEFFVFSNSRETD